nr:iron-containing alcohol dehydrogenase [Gammaproteobacteria bacterium]
MNIFKKFFIRTFQFILYKACYLLPFRQPELLKDNDDLIKKIKELSLDNAFLVIDPGIYKLSLADNLTKSLNDNNIKFTIFTDFEANPKIKDVEKGVIEYKNNNSKFIIAMGGGSAMDTAKAIGARIVRPNKSIEQLKGLLKVHKKIPTLFAIPTTAGTGSETTIASVIINEKTSHKYSINSLNLTPRYALLDASLTIGLPKSITAFTGMDALTHATEGYITRDVPKKHKRLAEEAIISIMDNMLEVYNNPKNLEARSNMLHASFKAGVVFTRVGLTYVHPIAHTLGGLYGVPHGLANARILPECLRYYGKKVYKKLAHLADICHLTNENMSLEEKANAYISKIEELNNIMGLNVQFDIKDE